MSAELDRRKLQAACEKLENDLASLTSLIQDIQVNAANVNTYALLCNEPTINFQIHGPDLREHCEAMWDQLSNIEAWEGKENDPKEPTLTLSPVSLEAVFNGFAEATKISGQFVLCFEPEMDDDRRVVEAASAIHSKIAYGVGAYKRDDLDPGSNIPGASLEFAFALHLLFCLANHLGMDLGQAYAHWAKRLDGMEGARV